MIKKIKQSLTIRIFLITTLLLICACAVTYCVIAWATPISYTTLSNDSLHREVEILLTKLEETNFADAEKLVNRFILDNHADVMVTDSEGRYAGLGNIAVDSEPDRATVYSKDKITSITITSGLAEDKGSVDSDSVTVKSAVVSSDSASQSYSFSFADSSETYILTILGNVKAMNQTTEALKKVAPLLAAVIFFMSVIGAVIYSRHITKPIVQISGISSKMSNLDFDWKCEDIRSDEIGVLGRSLNELSVHLSKTLTELQNANTKLQQDMNREQEIERQRLAFFSAASHELKTPLTIMKGQLSGMLSQIDIYQDRDKYLARSLAVAGRMESMVQEILTVTRMESSNFTANTKELDLSLLAQKQIELDADLFEQKNLHLETDFASDAVICGDGILLLKVMDNLLSNAIFYSPQDETISMNIRRRDDGIFFSIANTGSQIPKEDIPHLFEPFYRVEQSRGRSTGGSGLGLYIVKMILDHHGAEYRIQNGKDSVKFTILFPAI